MLTNTKKLELISYLFLKSGLLQSSSWQTTKDRPAFVLFPIWEAGLLSLSTLILYSVNLLNKESLQDNDLVSLALGRTLSRTLFSFIIILQYNLIV